jgi:hypothetical protein
MSRKRYSRNEDIKEKIAKGRYTYDKENKKLYDTLLKEDVSDLIEGDLDFDNSESKDMEDKQDEKDIEHKEEIEEQKESNKKFLGVDIKSIYLSESNITMILFQDEEEEKIFLNSKYSKHFTKTDKFNPHFNYDIETSYYTSVSKFGFPLLKEAFNILNLFERKDYSDDVKIYIKPNYPITINAELSKKVYSTNNVFIVIANRID